VADAVVVVCEAAEDVGQEREEDREAVGDKEVSEVVVVQVDRVGGLDGGVDGGAVVGRLVGAMEERVMVDLLGRAQTHERRLLVMKLTVVLKESS
jgi:hypothetical protein